MAAGFWAGFGEQFSQDLGKRQDSLDALIKENLANARIAKRDYAKRKSLADTILDTTQAIQNKYGLKDEQAIALAEAYGTDLPGLQVKLDQTDTQVRSTGGVGLGAEQVMSYVNMTNELAPLNGMTKLQAIERLMGLNATELAKEADPKSEGAQTRSFIRAALAYDPQLQAAEKMQNIKGPGGMSYAQLLEMQEAGFAPEDVVGGVTRSGGLAYDYTASTPKQTRSEYARLLSINVFDGSDLTDQVQYNDYSSSSDTDKASLKASVLGAGTALARLEKDIVLSNLGKDLSLNAFRKAILDDIYDRVNSPEELDTLKESVANGTALKIVQRTGGKLTDDDIDAIISGADVEEGATTDVDMSGTPSFRDRSDEIVSATPKAEPKADIPAVLTEELRKAWLSMDPENRPNLEGVTDPEIARMLLTVSEDEQEPESVSETGAAATAQLNIDNAEKRAASVSDITYSDWKKLSRQERKDKGYPVRNIDGVYTDPDAWKPEPEDTSGESKPTLNTTSFVDKYGKELGAFINENETDVTDKEEIKSTLAAWFSDNAGNPEIRGSMDMDTLTELVYNALNR
jgi:hypothetical protein